MISPITTTPLSAPCEKYSQLLRKLHQLIATGKGDNDEADALRDDMDSLWRALSSTEITYVRELSVELYRIAETTVAH